MTWSPFIPHPALAGRSLLTLRHHPPEAVAAILDTADRLKAEPRDGWPPLLAGKVIALIFERPSTRTRVSFVSGIARLGGTSLVLSPDDMQLGRGESIEDTAKVLGRMVDAIMLRTGPQATLVELDRHAGVPVINGLTYEHHPCQALADAQTLRERFGDLSGLRVAWLGDGNNCCVSLMVVGALTGMAITAACPDGYTPDPELVAWADATARARGGEVRMVSDPVEAVAGARGLFTDTWVSMGDEGPRTRGAPCSRPTASTTPCSTARPPTRWRCTACPRTTARRSPTRCSTVPGRRCGTRPRTACTPRRPCWRTPWDEHLPQEAAPPRVEPTRWVPVAFARHQPEAEMLAGLLAELEIPCFMRRTTIDVPDMMAGGPRELLVPGRPGARGAGAARSRLEPLQN